MTALRSRVTVTAAPDARSQAILSEDAVDFVVALHAAFAARRADLLRDRQDRRRQLLAGQTLDFLPETAGVRSDPTWQVAPPAPGLIDRRVEITGPTDRKMTINALNSGAQVWMADFEDANSPTWSNMVLGQLNLRDAVEHRIELTNDDGRRYVLGEDLATIVVRPRGLHLVEKHFLVDGHAVPAALFDFGLYFFHCARKQIEAGAGPYFYLPKLEHHAEARWWNDVFVFAQDALGLPRGTIRATVLIETVPAALQMEEILFELREHSAGLNAGRWDYLFSMLKNFGNRPEFLLPDRSSVTMTVPFLRAYTELLVSTCHRRGAHAIGGMSAFIPSRDARANEMAFAQVGLDKAREAGDGFDGSWVAHPGLVPTCEQAFDAVLEGRPNQIARQVSTTVTAADLLAVDRTPGKVTAEGVRANVSIAFRYLDFWLRGIGAAAIDNLMEDAATAEISRCQLRQWIELGVTLEAGTVVTAGLVGALIDDEYERLAVSSGAGPGGSLDQARTILRDLVLADRFREFFTVGAYADHLADARPGDCRCSAAA